MDFVDKPRAFVTLDGLRAVAAISVLTLHIPQTLMGGRPLMSAYLAVDLFFCLSGYVLARAYGDRLCTDMSASEFLLRRLIRLFPLYFLAGAIRFGQLFYSQRFATDPYWSTALVYGFNLFYLPIPVEPLYNLYPINSPSWSLGFELLVNIVFGLWAALLLRVPALRLIIAASFLALVAVAAYFGNLDVGYLWSNAIGGAARVFFSFFAGVGVERIYRSRAFQLPRFSSYLLLACLLFIFRANPIPNDHLGFDLMVVATVFPLLVYFGACCEPGRYGKLVMSVLGASSYAIYVLQVPLGRVFVSGVDLLRISHSRILSVLFMFVMIVVSVCADALYDVPVRRWITAHVFSGRSRINAGQTERRSQRSTN